MAIKKRIKDEKQDLINIRLKNSKILIIDDSEDILELISRILIQESFLPIPMTSPVKALKMVNRNIDVIILDLMMPEMNGLDFLKKIREKTEFHHIPIIVITAKLNNEEDIVNLFKSGANDYITKPFLKDELIARIRSHANLKKNTERLFKTNNKLLSRNNDLQKALKREEVLNEKILERTIELQEANEKIAQLNIALEYSSSHDVLTEILNRGAILQYLENDIKRARRLKNKLSLIMFDIDHFKVINDTYGHLVGDTVLMQLSKQIKELIRDIDLFGRYGGEEFIIILPDTSIDQGMIMAKRLLKKVEMYKFLANNIEFNVTISIGITEYIQNETIDKFIERTDEALYDAKKSGRNCIKIK
jgi:diguanylate cyclase (GGDEF)-like protein